MKLLRLVRNLLNGNIKLASYSEIDAGHN